MFHGDNVYRALEAMATKIIFIISGKYEQALQLLLLQKSESINFHKA